MPGNHERFVVDSQLTKPRIWQQRSFSTIYHRFPSLCIEPLSSRLNSDLRSEENSEQRDFYADAIQDFARLIDEVRFETSIAAAFISNLKEILFKEVDEEDLSRTVGVSREVLALLAPYVAQNWLPTDLFSRPEVEISESRILGD